MRTQALDTDRHKLGDCPYPVRLTLLRWSVGEEFRHSTLISFSGAEELPTADLFPTYHQRQDVEAGIKQGKGTFGFTKLHVRSPAESGYWDSLRWPFGPTLCVELRTGWRPKRQVASLRSCGGCTRKSAPGNNCGRLRLNLLKSSYQPFSLPRLHHHRLKCCSLKPARICRGKFLNLDLLNDCSHECAIATLCQT